MKLYQLSFRQILFERIGVAVTFLCLGICAGLFIATWLPPRFLANRQNIVYLFLAMMFLIVWPSMLLLIRRGFASDSTGSAFLVLFRVAGLSPGGVGPTATLLIYPLGVPD